jgi:4a-hydroxytetrahydrobiopterin dehydratase
MSKREKLSDEAVVGFVADHQGWERAGNVLVKTFAFEDYAAGIAFAVRIGFAAEKRDHHPDLHIGWCRVKVSWSTHDAEGITVLDTDMAELSDRLHTS